MLSSLSSILLYLPLLFLTMGPPSCHCGRFNLTALETEDLRQTWAEWEGLKWSWYTKSQAYWHLCLSCHRSCRKLSENGVAWQRIPGRKAQVAFRLGISQKPFRNRPGTVGISTGTVGSLPKNESLNLNTFFPNGIHGFYGNSNSSWTVPERFVGISQANRHVRCILWNTCVHSCYFPQRLQSWTSRSQAVPDT